jgi:phage terminase large subunit-like protein
MLGQPLLPWQQYVADVAMEVDPETGKLAYNDITLVAPRQSGKTSLVLPKILHRALGFGRTPQKILYTAQTADKAREKWRDLYIAKIQTSPLAEMIAPGSPRLRLNAEQLAFTTGSTFVPVTPTARTGGTGDTIDEAHIDEAWAFEDSGVEQAMSPAMVTRDQPQLWIESTAKRQPKGQPRNPQFAGYLRGRIAAGRARCEAGITTDTAYFEWSAPLDLDPQDPKTWWSSVPALGHTVTEDAMRVQFARMDLADFCAEFLGWWPSDAALRWQIIPEARWRQLASRGVKPGYPIAFGVDTAPERDMSAIVAAGPANLAPDPRGALTDRWAVEVVEHRPGSAWVVKRMVDLCERWRPCGIAIATGGTAASLIPMLEAEGLPVKPMHGPAMAKAYGAWIQAAADDGSLRHAAQPELDTAVSLAWRRKIGAQSLIDWSSPGDVSPVVAMTCALWAAQVYGPDHKALDYDVLRSVY